VKIKIKLRLTQVHSVCLHYLIILQGTG